ncbi:DUF4856 domain-containing protein [Phaeocystidibacter marisrubri]|uniref:DUF4856 domain-containing protein n=2 Tax=Phaeocystidibacter marisrubri TaxID=1577780 RepID=A0A6L3ZEW1_9FLAO|nr:DUF4856 domain-containing protein [Phaeocystidibacter marisrubri]
MGSKFTFNIRKFYRETLALSAVLKKFNTMTCAILISTLLLPLFRISLNHNTMRYTLPVLAVLTLAACSKEEDPKSKTAVPSTYSFERNGESTVSFNGQIQRQAMLGELSNAVKAGTEGTINYQDLVDMYENANNPFSDAELNASGKSLSTKTSASATHVFDQGTSINFFKTILQAAADASAAGSQASDGVAGVISNGDGSRKYLVAENGLEYAQILQKGMMGAVFMDQMVNNYLTPLKLNVDNDASAVESYTAMEHHWDEAYGYFSIVQDYNVDPSVSQSRGYWGGYLLELEESFNLASDVYLAFRTGRQAIVEKNYSVRDAQADIIAEKMEMACYIKALSYLNKGAARLNTGEAAVGFHALSEGVGFIYSLRFIASESVTAAQSDAWIATLTDGSGFWSGDIQTRIESVKTSMGNTLGLSEDIVNGTY